MEYFIGIRISRQNCQQNIVIKKLIIGDFISSIISNSDRIIGRIFCCQNKLLQSIFCQTIR
jgi:hypothetical protein